MRLTTLCYILDEGTDRVLMLHRNKKEEDENAGKWIGVGGKVEEGESPDECLLREVREETGLELKNYDFRGIITFVSDEWGTEQMILYTASRFEGELKECDEGELKWVDRKRLKELELWEGDRAFIDRLFADDGPIFLKLIYAGDELVKEIFIRHSA